jgi:hypothetical protein
MAAEQGRAGFGRHEGKEALRDAVHLTQPGDHPGPAGAWLNAWYRVVRRPAIEEELARLLSRLSEDRIAEALGKSGSNPVRHASRVLASTLSDIPRAEPEAVMLADVALSQALRFERVLPLLSLALEPRALHRKTGDLDHACYRALVTAAGKVVPMASDLARRAARLTDVAPTLRAKGAKRAVDMFLSRDVLRPTDFDTFMSDRAARRLCDRLLALGAVREMTGRASFRLYGL